MNDRSSPPLPHWIIGSLFAAAVLYPFGVGLPSMEFHEALSESTYSIVSGVLNLLSTGEFILGLAIGIFSLLFPAAKIVVLFIVWRRRIKDEEEWIDWLGLLGKWSMLDVYVVAILVGAVEFGVLAHVESRPGIFVFAASVIASMIAAHGLHRHRVAKEPTELSSATFNRLRSAGARTTTAFAFALFVGGSCVPLMTVEKWWWWSSDYTVVTSVIDLFGRGEFGLAILLALLVIVAPLLHFGGMLVLRFWPKLSEKAIDRLLLLEEWAMFDVYGLALVLVLTKLGGIANVEPRTGLWMLFAATIIGWVDRRLFHAAIGPASRR